MTCKPAGRMTDIELFRARENAGAEKAAIRSKFNWRSILLQMEMAGEEWRRDAAGDLTIKPRWKSPICDEHRKVVEACRGVNERIDELNAEYMERRLGTGRV